MALSDKINDPSKMDLTLGKAGLVKLAKLEENNYDHNLQVQEYERVINILCKNITCLAGLLQSKDGTFQWDGKEHLPGIRGSFTTAVVTPEDAVVRAQSVLSAIETNRFTNNCSLEEWKNGGFVDLAYEVCCTDENCICSSSDNPSIAGYEEEPTVEA